MFGKCLENVKEKGLDNNLLELIAADPSFNLTLEELQATMDPAKYVGRSPVQVDQFLNNVIKPILDANKDILGVKAEIHVQEKVMTGYRKNFLAMP